MIRGKENLMDIHRLKEDVSILTQSLKDARRKKEDTDLERLRSINHVEGKID
jgi:hypothetical protein